MYIGTYYLQTLDKNLKREEKNVMQCHLVRITSETSSKLKHFIIDA